MSGFKTCEQKGFHIEFPNGWTASVQFGFGNYSDNYDWRGDDPSDYSSRHTSPAPKSRTAEIAAWNNDGWHDFGDDTVKGHCTVPEVLAFLNEIAAKPAIGEAP